MFCFLCSCVGEYVLFSVFMRWWVCFIFCVYVFVSVFYFLCLCVGECVLFSVFTCW